MPDPHLRAADADRAAVAQALGEHMSAGRLTVAEFDERLGRAYAAKTYGELDELTADLPRLGRAKTAEVQQAAPAGACGPWAGGWEQSHAWRAWLTTSLIVVTVWAVTSLANWQLIYFWPVWVIGPWGAVLLARTLTGRDRDDDHPTGPHKRLRA
jgi:hypothetical protein